MPSTPTAADDTASAGSGEPVLVRVERFEDPELAHVAEIVLDRPEAMNAVSTAMARAIAAATARVAADESVRCVVLSSSHPTAFCVGADLKERNRLTDDELRAQRPGNRAAYRSVLDLPVPDVPFPWENRYRPWVPSAR